MRLFVTRRVDGTATRLGAAYVVPGLTYAAGNVLRLQFQALRCAHGDAGREGLEGGDEGSLDPRRCAGSTALLPWRLPEVWGSTYSSPAKAAKVPYQMRFDNFRATSTDEAPAG